MLEHVEPETLSFPLRQRLAGRRSVEQHPAGAVEVDAGGHARSDDRPRLGEGTAPLTDDQVATLVDLVRADRREDYDFLCSAFGVTNGPDLWDGVRRRARG